MGQSDWFYDMGSDWEVSNKLAKVNPYYSWYKNAAKQMAMYGPAKHVGKINRGQFFNPELNTPADRAYGYQSDFNPKELSSGAFKYKPQGQKFRATAVHVNEGLASFVGEVRTMPVGQHVQEDGTILVQTPYRGDPCNPNPCTTLRMPTCTAVNKFTAKCSRSKDYILTLRWFNPNTENENEDLDLYIKPDFHDGTPCEATSSMTNEEEDCGAITSEDETAGYVLPGLQNVAEESARLTTLADGTKYQDYTYAVFAEHDDYNLSENGATLTVEYDGVVKQTLAVPQYNPDRPFENVNYDADIGRGYYFFGCFRPQTGTVDTRGAGFYYDDSVVFGGLELWDAGLCKALLDWSGGLGFNPHEQSGSGDERYD